MFFCCSIRTRTLTNRSRDCCATITPWNNFRITKLEIFQEIICYFCVKFQTMQKINKQFFLLDALKVAQELIGKTLVRVFDDGTVKRYQITITEAYLGDEDLACHASKGRTPRTEVMFHEGGKVYVYLIYGMYWMLNVVSAEENKPQAVLICGIGDVKGSGRVGRELKIDKSFYGEDLNTSDRIWIENSDEKPPYKSVKRVGVDYAGEWRDKLWRFEIER